MQSQNLRPLFGWRAAICLSDLPPSVRHVLLTLSLHMNELGGSCFPSVTTLVEETGLSRRTVFSAIKHARKNHWLHVSKHGLKGQRWANNEYQAEIPRGATIALANDKVVQPLHQRGANNSTRGVQPLHTNSSYNSSITLQRKACEKKENPVDKSKFLTGLRHVKSLIKVN